ncbi:MAG: sigma factor, partial [Verrucomicrobiota bacterium]
MNSLTLSCAAAQNPSPVPADEADDFRELIRRFERPLLQYATHILGDRDRARDVVQETFLQLRHA